MLCFLLVFFAAACGRDFDDPVGPSQIDTDAVLAQAWGAFTKGDYETALATYQELLSDVPDLSEARNGLGWSAVRLHRLEMGQAAFEENSAQEAEAAMQAQAALAGLLLLEPGVDVRRSIALTGVVVNSGQDFSSDHEPGLDAGSMNRTLAMSLLLQGQYEEAATSLEKLGRPVAVEDLGALLMALQELDVSVQAQ